MRLSATPFTLSATTAPKIEVTPSPTTTPGTPVDATTLELSTRMHVEDVKRGIDFIVHKLNEAKLSHDHTKFEQLELFLAAYNSGFKDDAFFKMHRTSERHHLDPSIKDINLLDILEHMVDGIVAGKARKGTVYPFKLAPELLEAAVTNTAKLIESHVVIKS